MSTVANNNKTKSDRLDVINPSKGEEINISKEVPYLNKVIFWLGNDINDSNKYYVDINIAASVFLDDYTERTDEEMFELYNSWVSYNEEVVGAENKQAIINLSTVPENTDKITISATIDNDGNDQKSVVVDNAYCGLLDAENNDKGIIHFDIGEEISTDDIIIVGELYRHNGDWKLKVVGQKFEGGLEEFNKGYGAYEK